MSYTLALDTFSHDLVISGNRDTVFTRNSAIDYGSPVTAYGWTNGSVNRWTSSSTPSVGDGLFSDNTLENEVTTLSSVGTGSWIAIKTGLFKRINGAAEVCQRVKVSLWHYFDEYFLNRSHGIPYYSSKNIGDAILGSKMSKQTMYNLFRKKILAVPGVLQVKNANITRLGRDYYYSCSIVVAPGPNDTTLQEISIQNIALGG